METTITEALAEIKLLEKKLTRVAEELASACVVTTPKDPYQEQGGFRTYVASKIQAYSDICSRILAIRSAISEANTRTFVEIDGLNLSIADWLVYRREIHPKMKSMMESINARYANEESRFRNTRQQAYQIVNPLSPQQNTVDSIEYAIPRAVLAEKIDGMETLIDTLDGKLSLLNAKTVIEIPDNTAGMLK